MHRVCGNSAQADVCNRTNTDTAVDLEVLAVPRSAHLPILADLQGVANWNAVSKYRAGFNKTAQLQEEEKRQAGVEAMRVNLAHQRSHMAAMKRAKAEERAREQAASERLQAEYKADMEREKAKADEKARRPPTPYACAIRPPTARCPATPPPPP